MPLRVVGLALMMLGTLAPEATHSFEEGQVWEYKTRAGEDSSTLLINKVEADEKLGEIFHISVRDVRVVNPSHPEGMSRELPHFPVSLETMRASCTKLVGTAPIDPAYLEGYKVWRGAFEAGEAGVFTIQVSEIVAYIESVVSKPVNR